VRMWLLPWRWWHDIHIVNIEIRVGWFGETSYTFAIHQPVVLLQ